MLSVNSLPFVITEQILRYATISDYDHISTWTGHLCLLSICQQWRHIGIPILYKHIFFQAVSNAPETNTINLTRIHIDGLDQKVVASNIGLACQIGAARYAKHFKIRVKEFCHLNWLFSIIILSHRDYPELWPGIQSLNLQSYICKDKLSYVDELSIGDSSTNAINERLLLTARIVKLAMPNVYSFVIGGNADSDFVKPMTDNLAIEYSPQLSYLLSSSALASYSDAQFTDSLKYLRLSLDKNAKNILPKIPAQQLEHLALSDVNENFSWKCFQPESPSADLVFDNLKILKLGMIDVCTASSDYRDYSKISLSKIDYVRFRYLSSEESFSDEFYEETSFFYNQVDVNRYSSLIIENTHSLDISRVAWGNLKGLAFHVIDFDKLMPLLQKLENVTCLHLVKLNTSDFDFADDPDTWSIQNSMLANFAIKKHVEGNPISEFFNAL
ncbi:hypothetical protein GGF40_001474 [Coemansia sp. RSA 1286]|nr:hypothetical protein GGF40_001474 [Coemansia sp. RSA 1286]